MPWNSAGPDAERRGRRARRRRRRTVESQQPIHRRLVRVHLLGADHVRMRFGGQERSPNSRKEIFRQTCAAAMRLLKRNFSFFLSFWTQISEHHYDVPHLVSPSPPPLPPGMMMMPSPGDCEPPLSLMSLASSPRPSSHSTMDKNPHSDSDRSLSSTLSSSCKFLLSFQVVKRDGF